MALGSHVHKFVDGFPFNSAEDSPSNNTSNDSCEQDTSNETSNSSAHSTRYSYTAIGWEGISSRRTMQLDKFINYKNMLT